MMQKCKVCGWPLKKDGCMNNNCSMRPIPTPKTEPNEHDALCMCVECMPTKRGE